MRLRLATSLLCLSSSTSLDNGVGQTPAMGWNSWNVFRCEIHEELIREVARAMVDSGLRDAGYHYVNLDDCWQAARDNVTGHILPFEDKFPSGMKALGDYIHSLGLKFGVYSGAGDATCEGEPGSGSRGHEEMDALDYASWGVDYVKYDFCGMDDATEEPRYYYELMRDALNATGRPMVFSVSSWGTGKPHLWHGQVGHSWRTGRDLFAVWDEHGARDVLRLPDFMQSFMSAVEGQHDYADYAGPGAFNDPDMLVVGLEGMTPYGVVSECPSHLPAGACEPGSYVTREQWGMVGGLTHTEQRTQFAFWCMLSAPLILSADPRHLSAATMRILTAPELLAINQDPLARQARRVWTDGSLQIWRKDLADHGHALLLLNSGTEAQDITVRWSRDLSDVARRWSKEMPRVPECLDDPKMPDCVHWAADGECSRNPTFMDEACRRSCDKCPPALYEGKQATALVRDVWEREYVGIHVALYTAKHVEPHAARVITVKFEEPGMAQHRTLEKLVEAEQDARRKARARASAPPTAATAAEAAPEMGEEVDLGACVDEHGFWLLLLIVCVAGAMHCCEAGRRAPEVKSERHAV